MKIVYHKKVSIYIQISKEKNKHGLNQNNLEKLRANVIKAQMQLINLQKELIKFKKFLKNKIFLKVKDLSKDQYLIFNFKIIFLILKI